MARPREQVHFARIFAKQGASRGMRDYVYFEAEDQKKGDDGEWKFWIRVWKNDGKSSVRRDETCGKGHN